MSTTIEPDSRAPQPPPPPPGSPAVTVARDWRGELANASALKAVTQLWQGFRAASLPLPPPASVWLAFARKALAFGDFLLCTEILDSCPKDAARRPTIRQLRARAFSQTGRTQRARVILRELIQEEEEHRRSAGYSVCDTYAALGRTYKDDWLATGDPQALAKALDAYRKAATCSREEAYYPLVNVATLELLRGDRKAARAAAKEVLELCRELVQQSSSGSRVGSWIYASQGEAYVCLGQLEQAAEAYGQYAAHICAQSELGRRDLATTRRQARLALKAQGRPQGELDHCFKLSPVVVFAGHMIDRPDAKAARFPEEIAPILKARLTQLFDERRVELGFSSAAAGADILFAEALLGRHGELRLILSSPPDSFRQGSVDYLAGGDWGQRFDCVREQAQSVTLANYHHPQYGSKTYQFATLVMCGLAGAFARQLGLDLVALCFWDGQPGYGEGGTADFYAYWERYNQEQRDGGDAVELVAISPADLCPQRAELRRESKKVRERNGSEASRQAASAQRASSHRSVSKLLLGSGFAVMRQEIQAVLFADVVKFSALGEEQLPRFIQKYLGTVSTLISEATTVCGPGGSCAPILVNTWGDAFYMIFDSVAAAGQFALKMQEKLVGPPVGRAAWEEEGLPAELSLRIALHAGPVYFAVDPVTRQLTFTGRHVTVAARLEPVTERGEIYCTEAFAALAFGQRDSGFRCESLGPHKMSKDAGSMSVFRVASNRFSDD